MLHRSKIEHLSESLSKTMEDISFRDILSYEQIFPHFETLFPSSEILEKLRNGLKFPNTLDLESGKKYLVSEGEKYISLIEEREGEVRICVNNIE